MSRPKLTNLDRLLEAFASMDLQEMEDSLRSLNAMHRAAIRNAAQRKLDYEADALIAEMNKEKR